jgi:hypothetical protein
MSFLTTFLKIIMRIIRHIERKWDALKASLTQGQGFFFGGDPPGCAAIS